MWPMPSQEAEQTMAKTPSGGESSPIVPLPPQPVALPQPAALPQPTVPPPASVRLGLHAVTLLSVTALVAGGIGGFIGARVSDGPGNGSSLPEVPIANVDRPEGSIAAIAAEAMPSVVKIEALSNGTVVATGSGFIISEDGYIVTNAHVSGASDGGLIAVFSDGTENDATIVGDSVDYDLAVLKVDLTGLAPLVLGDSDNLVVGDPVIAVGSPLGLDSTVTTGIVSALHRPVEAGGNGTVYSFIDAIQTDAAINPGNSGGPLLNSQGQVIGITSAIAALPGATAETGAGSVGLGFAIPSNQVRRTADQIIATGVATFPLVGVLLDSQYTGDGARVAEDDPATGTVGVVVDGPADRAGIKAGDIILAIDGRPITEAPELIVAIRAKAVGDTVVLKVRTGTTTRDVTVTLADSDAITHTVVPDN
jgi:putative serine protease PepD